MSQPSQTPNAFDDFTLVVSIIYSLFCAIWVFENSIVFSPTLGVMGGSFFFLCTLWYYVALNYVNTVNDERDLGWDHVDPSRYKPKELDLTTRLFCVLSAIATLGNAVGALLTGYLCFVLLEPGLTQFALAYTHLSLHPLIMTLAYVTGVLSFLTTLNLGARYNIKLYWRLQLEPLSVPAALAQNTTPSTQLPHDAKPSVQTSPATTPPTDADLSLHLTASAHL